MTEPTAIFVGDLSYRPNLQGLRWFFSSIFPAVRNRFSNAQMIICGRAPNPEVVQWLRSIDGVEVYASPKDLGPFYRKARASIVPLLTGGGSRLKIPEAMAWGVPVVSTSKGSEGLDLAASSEIMLADTPESFAQALIQLYAEEFTYETLRDNGRRRVLEDYDWNVLARTLVEFYDSIEPKEAPR